MSILFLFIILIVTFATMIFKKLPKSTGLGLYMSSIIINKHLQGKLSATNKDDACFIVRLPKVKSDYFEE
ncbi:MAG: hypothetical protein H8E76_02725 [Helicobacteraceae bacterium]|nr:hypothetical protein [Candidatus Sulfurimonas ponti]